MSMIFPHRAVPAARAARPASPPVSAEALDVTRQEVRKLLESSDAFAQLSPDKREQLAKGMVQIASYLAEPDGVRLKPAQQSPQVRALAGNVSARGSNTSEDGKFTAQGAREGAAVAGALLQQVNFPEFCAGLINGVFHSIVQSSIEQMEAYAKLVADVSKSLNDFRDENTTQNQGRDHLVSQFPDLFQLSMDTGEFAFGDEQAAEGASAGPRVTLREGVDERRAVDRLNQSLPLERPLERLDDDLVEALLVPAARTQLASSRQQLLATMVMLGINRIVITDGKLSAKVMYDFQARDNMQYRRSAQQFDYGDQYATTSAGDYESSREGGERSSSYSKDAGYQSSVRDGSYYSKGTYKTTSQPVLKMASASQTSIDASLQTKASLAGTMEVNFKSDYLPLEKMANPESIAAIQMNAQPGMVKTLATNRPPPAASGGGGAAAG